ncbi:MAG: CocE/NonD family hydrolase [Candidatus Limnocylindrales bacterium]
MSVARDPDPRSASGPQHAAEPRREVGIPVRDGLVLSASLWLPVPRPDAPDERFPAILEMIPYRKDDWRWADDEARGGWLAARGYALCRLDVRGTGSSPGVARDEYTAEETLDGYDAVEWLASQPWCTGNVGMWGISYGGFTAIQVAKLRPPHLRAIVPMYATDDRYTDDVHYVGGCVTVSELSQYAVSMVGSNALPARPVSRGDRWLDEWRERLEGTPVWSFEWLRQQHDGPYWRQGSLAPDWGALSIPTFLIAGWMDGYVDPALRMLERCVNAPRRALVGNWVHSFPDDAYPGPNLDWLHEFVRFFDHWLKEIDNGWEAEPALTCFVRDFAPPEPFPETWPGAWRSEPSFPPPGATDATLWLARGEQPLSGRLAAAAPTAPAIDRFPHRATTGTGAALSWGAGGPPNGLARDLRSNDGLVPTYTGEPLAEPLVILGMPVAVLTVEASMAVATVVVRLTDVAPDGTVAQVTAGILNLTHRDSHEAPEPLEPGRAGEVHVRLRAAGYRFAPGHRVRISVASSYWPVIWPSPFPGELGIHLGASRLVLPAIPAGDGSLATPALKTTPAGLPAIATVDREDPSMWRIVDDVLAGTVTVTTSSGSETTLPDGSALYSSELLEMTASDADPARATMRTEVVYRLRQDGRRIGVRAGGLTTSTATDFAMQVELDVDLDGEPFFQRAWSETIPRRLV